MSGQHFILICSQIQRMLEMDEALVHASWNTWGHRVPERTVIWAMKSGELGSEPTLAGCFVGQCTQFVNDAHILSLSS